MHPITPGKDSKRRSRKRVVIVDDSRSLRVWLRKVLSRDLRLDVVGEAASAEEARTVIRKTAPDVITLDIQMPGMDGLEFLSRLMSLRPMPVVMFSGATSAGSCEVIEALSLGAVDCIMKPLAEQDVAADRDLARRVFAAACSTLPPPKRLGPRRPARTGKTPHTQQPLVVIGASTGGVTALETVLAEMKRDGPPVMVVQHMPQPFLLSFVTMLDETLSCPVGFVRDGAEIKPGEIMFAPAEGRHSQVVQRGTRWYGKLTEIDTYRLHCPAVDALFTSAEPFAEAVVATLLTGLGRDGAQAMQRLKAAGAHTIGQDAATSVVYGMPRVAFEIGGVSEQRPLNRIGTAINTAVARLYRDMNGASA